MASRNDRRPTGTLTSPSVDAPEDAFELRLANTSLRRTPRPHAATGAVRQSCEAGHAGGPNWRIGVSSGNACEIRQPGEAGAGSSRPTGGYRAIAAGSPEAVGRRGHRRRSGARQVARRVLDARLRAARDGLPLALFLVEPAAVRGRLRSHSLSAISRSHGPRASRRSGGTPAHPAPDAPPPPGAGRRIRAPFRRSPGRGRNDLRELAPMASIHAPGAPGPSARSRACRRCRGCGRCACGSWNGPPDADLVEQRRPFEEAPVDVFASAAAGSICSRKVRAVSATCRAWARSTP